MNPNQGASEAEQTSLGNSAADVSSRRKDSTAWVGNVYRIFTKVFSAKPFTIEQEKRFKDLFSQARSEDNALDAIDLMFREGVTYPTGRDLREAVERVNLRTAEPERPAEVREDIGYGDGYDPLRGYEDPMRYRGPSISFRDWFLQQDDEMKARVKRVFPSMTIYAEKHDPPEEA